jgi:hypothetical protein
MWSILRGSILSLYVVPLILKTVEMTILQISDTHNSAPQLKTLNRKASKYESGFDSQ